MRLERTLKEVLEYIFQPGDVVRSLPTGKIYTVEETVHEGMKVYLLPRQQSDERLYNFAYQLLLVQMNDTNILKPTPEKPLIVKSGGTKDNPGYVAYWKGINYLFQITDSSADVSLLRICFEADLDRKAWKSFTGENPDITELTDELALLRPIIKNPAYNNSMMINIDGHQVFIKTNLNGIEKHCTWIHIDNCQLATCKDLQNAE